MGAILGLIMSKAGGALIGGAGVLFALALAFFKGRSSGARKEQDRQRAARDRTNRDIDNIEDAVAGREPDENRERLKKWSGE